MTVVRAQTRFFSEHEAEDDAVCTLHFVGQGDNWTNILDMVDDFWTDAAGNASIGQRISGHQSNGEAEIKLYNLDDEKPRMPVASRTITIAGNTTGNAPPPQCSTVLSYYAEPVSGIPRGRLRGRLYIPWPAGQCLDANGEVASSWANDLAASATELLDAAHASLSWDWCVYSPTRAAGGDSPDDGAAVVMGGWVDNSFDIQRRRKVAATARVTWEQS